MSSHHAKAIFAFQNSMRTLLRAPDNLSAWKEKAIVPGTRVLGFYALLSKSRQPFLNLHNFTFSSSCSLSIELTTPDKRKLICEVWRARTAILNFDFFLFAIFAFIEYFMP